MFGEELDVSERDSIRYTLWQSNRYNTSGGKEGDVTSHGRKSIRASCCKSTSAVSLKITVSRSYEVEL